MKFINRSSKSYSLLSSFALLLAMTVSFFGNHTSSLVVLASNETIAFGSLSNFDVFCVTQNTEECHGFEIELEGIHCEDITRTFGGTYSRYGVPTRNLVTDTQGNAIACIVEYASSYDSNSGTFSSTTVVPAQILNGGRIGTNGHRCYLGGMGAAAYDSSGCEHFGVSLRKVATKTSYYWLVADSQNQGQLKRDQAIVGIGNVNWSAFAVNNGGGNNIVVRAEVEAPDPPLAQCAKFGEAKWVKVNVTELEVETELEDLLSDNQVIVEAESEVEWKILQARPTCDELGRPLEVQPENAFVVEAKAADSSKTVIRRYEFFEYTGAYDPENHEVVLLVDEDTPQDSEIGNYLGSQMAAINFQQDVGVTPSPTASPTAAPTELVAPLAITTAPLLQPFATVNYACSYSLEASGGRTPYTWTLRNGQQLPSGLTLNATGTIQGTPTTIGEYAIKLRVSDSDNSRKIRRFTLKVNAPALLTIVTKKVLPWGIYNTEYNEQIQITGGIAPYTFSIVKKSLPAGLTLDTATGMIQGTPTSTGKSPFFIQVEDSLGTVKRRKFIIRITN